MISRRKLLVGAAAVGALALYIVWPNRQHKLISAAFAGEVGVEDLQAEKRGLWVHITADNRLIFFSPSTELGQGVHSGLAQIVAAQLDFPIDRIQVEDAPAIKGYGNPKSFGLRITGGSTTMTGFYEPLMQAMQQARQMILAAAAIRADTPIAKLKTDQGHVVLADETRLSYGSLITLASQQATPSLENIKPTRQSTQIIGQPIPRADIRDKVTGQAVYTVDVQRPDMVFASIRHYPLFGVHVLSPTNLTNIKQMPGIASVLELESGVICVGKTSWHAMQACQAIAFGNADQPLAIPLDQQVSDAVVREKLQTALDAEGVKETGATNRLQASFELPYLAHQTLEPQSCVADARSDRADIWTGTQAQDNAQKVAAEAAELSNAQVFIHTTYAGGGFGRRAETEMIAAATQASKQLGKAVKLIYSREEDTRHDFYRSATQARVQIGYNAAGAISGWHQQYATQSILSRIVAPVFDWIDYDPLALEGARHLPYAIDDLQTEVGLIQTSMPVGFWRSVAHSYTGFVTESCIDMLANRVDKDPWQYRYELLADKPRHLRVLERMRALSQWGSSLPSGVARGLALVESFGSIVAEVVEISQSEQGGPQLEKAYIVVDCGTAINPNMIRQQMEGGLIMGLSAALGEQINVADNAVVQANFDTYKVMRMANAPSSIAVEIIAEGDPIGGIGEVAVPPAAPALANAWFALTGQRVTSLPIGY